MYIIYSTLFNKVNHLETDITLLKEMNKQIQSFLHEEQRTRIGLESKLDFTSVAVRDTDKQGEELKEANYKLEESLRIKNNIIEAFKQQFANTPKEKSGVGFWTGVFVTILVVVLIATIISVIFILQTPNQFRMDFHNTPS